MRWGATIGLAFLGWALVGAYVATQFRSVVGIRGRIVLAAAVVTIPMVTACILYGARRSELLSVFDILVYDTLFYISTLVGYWRCISSGPVEFRADAQARKMGGP